MSKWGRPHGAQEPAEEEASQASGHTPQPYLSMPATLPELKEREGGAFQESSPPQGYGGEPVHSSLSHQMPRCPEHCAVHRRLLLASAPPGQT